MMNVSRETIRELQSAVAALPEQIDIDSITSHHWCEGLYARQMTIPAGAVVVGKTHAQQNFFLLVQGELLIATPDGPVTLTAPFMVTTQPGDKRAVYAVTDCICINFHPNPDNERDLMALENRYIQPEQLAAPAEKERLT